MGVRTTVLAFVAVAALAACGSSSKSTTSSTTVTPTTQPSSATSGQTDPQYAAYIGLTVEAATAKATADNRASRVSERDGVPQPGTLDYNPERLNFAVTNDKVTGVTTG